MKVRVAWRRIVHYVRTDLREIAFPSSLPDPHPPKPKPRKLKVREHFQVWKTASWLYIQSWRTGTLVDGENEEDKHQGRENPEDLSAVEEIALAARAGSENLRPALQRVYMTRVAVYRDALKNFVQGYQEGIGEVKAGSQSLKNEEGGDSPSGEGNHQPYATPPGNVESKKEQ